LEDSLELDDDFKLANALALDEADDLEAGLELDIDDLNSDFELDTDTASSDDDLDMFDVGTDFDDLSDDSSELDAVATKFDLARAYVDMGDMDSASSILKEVIDEGNSEQKAEAQALLDQSPS
ncbi:MAG: peptidoglycan-binding protein, partial [Gammaproteobacteria bacterium]|nr:peptidoglycan-binding protein [Gammaproteobacteria bacterium]